MTPFDPVTPADFEPLLRASLPRWLCLAAACSALATTTPPASAKIELIARPGDVFDVDGVERVLETVSILDGPIINDRGDFVVRGQFGPRSAQHEAFLTNRSGGLEAIGLPEVEIDGEQRALWNERYNWVQFHLDDAGNIYGDAFFPDGTEKAYYRIGRDHTTVLAASGDPIMGLHPDDTISRYAQLVVTPRGDVFLLGGVDHQSNSEWRPTMLIRLADGRNTVAVDIHSFANILPDGLSLDYLPYLPYWSEHGLNGFSVGRDSSLVFQAYVGGAAHPYSAALLGLSPDGSLETLLTGVDPPAASADGVPASLFRSPSVNSYGEVVVAANPRSDERSAVLSNVGGTEFVSVVRHDEYSRPHGEQNPGYFGQEFDFDRTVINDRGTVVFDGNAGTYVKPVDQPLYRLAGWNDPAFGFAEDVRLGRYRFIGINDSDQFAFWATLAGPGIDETNDDTIWFVDGDSEPQLVAREGDLVGVDPETNRQLILGELMIGHLWDPDEPTQRAFNDRGELVFQTRLLGDEHHVSAWLWRPSTAVPEPSGVAVLLASLLLGRRRRRR